MSLGPDPVMATRCPIRHDPFCYRDDIQYLSDRQPSSVSVFRHIKLYRTEYTLCGQGRRTDVLLKFIVDWNWGEFSPSEKKEDWSYGAVVFVLVVQSSVGIISDLKLSLSCRQD